PWSSVVVRTVTAAGSGARGADTGPWRSRAPAARIAPGAAICAVAAPRGPRCALGWTEVAEGRLGLGFPRVLEGHLCVVARGARRRRRARRTVGVRVAGE